MALPERARLGNWVPAANPSTKLIPNGLKAARLPLYRAILSQF